MFKSIIKPGGEPYIFRCLFEYLHTIIRLFFTYEIAKVTTVLDEKHENNTRTLISEFIENTDNAAW